MKFFRVLMIVACMSAAAGTHVVQAAGGRVGFIRLLSRVDTRTPIQVQAGPAFQRMLPRLLALQKQGSILEFEPELRAGIVKILYASGGVVPSVIGGNQIYAGIHDSIVSAPRQVAQTQQRAAAPAPIFALELYDSCFGAANLGAFSDVVGSLRDKTGRVVASYEGFADSTGSIALDCFAWSGSYTDVIPGYTVLFKVYDTTPALIGTYKVFAPAFSLTGIDQATALVSGRGPAGRPYQISWYHQNWDSADSWASSMKGGVISPAGIWSKDMGAMTFRGGSYTSLCRPR